MRLGFIVTAIVGWIMLGMTASDFSSFARAQEALPVATPDVIAPGVTFALIPPSENPPTLYRLSLEAGASLQFADDPAISLIYVESGSLTLMMDARLRDARPDTAGGNNAAATVAEGDYFVLPPFVAGELRNEGDIPASIVIAAITPALLPATAPSTPTTD